MFEINKEKLANEQAEAKAKRILSKMMSEFLLASDAPENVKVSILVLDKAQDIRDALTDKIVLKFCEPGKEAPTETLKKVLEYLELVELGIKQFLETTPFEVNTEEDEELC